MTRVEEFRLSHMDGLGDLLECYANEEDVRVQLRDVFAAPGSVAYTLLSARDEVIAIFGGLLFGGRMSIWAVCTVLVRKYPKAYHKASLEYLDRMRNEFGVVRFQSAVDVMNRVGIFHNLRLGFMAEGIMRKHGFRGQDQILFAKVF